MWIHNTRNAVLDPSSPRDDFGLGGKQLVRGVPTRQNANGSLAPLTHFSRCDSADSTGQVARLARHCDLQGFEARSVVDSRANSMWGISFPDHRAWMMVRDAFARLSSLVTLRNLCSSSWAVERAARAT